MELIDPRPLPRPAIVVLAHARPESTARLLSSIARADIAGDTPLVISIDHPTGERAELGAQVAAVADSFEWPHGPVTRIDHHGIGLVEHFFRCGNLTDRHDSVVLLEDDLLVGPGFLLWAAAALDRARLDDRIAGVSLTAPPFDGYRKQPFEPIDDGSDTIYAQVPWYDGMAFTRSMWQSFREWRSGADVGAVALHSTFDALGDDEWFPTLVAYLVDTGRQWMLPRSAFATGTGAAGAHFDDRTDWFQSELACSAPSAFRIASLDESTSVYDDHMELSAATMRRLAPHLDQGQLVVDLLGVRDLTDIDADALVLTTRPTEPALARWGAAMHPLAMNVVFEEPGDAIRLARAADVDTSAAGGRAAEVTLDRHRRRERSTRSSPRTLVSKLLSPSLLGPRALVPPQLSAITRVFNRGR